MASRFPKFMKFTVPIGANPIILMWGEKNNF
jgi:hypothetical protein